jgi:pSer/pThr/pTyr-binding forkhead associated (FHA) protein
MHVNTGEAFTLTIFCDSGPVTDFALARTSYVIGRDPRCDLHLDHQSVSRRHARLFWAEDAWFLSDLASTNGTLVNGNRITKKWLRHGDFIRLGRCKLQFNGTPSNMVPKSVGSAPQTKPETKASVSEASSCTTDLRKYHEEFPSARLKAEYPRIWEEISQKWGTSDGERYLHGLIYTERLGREGFSLDVMSELLCLLRIHPNRTQASLTAG